MTTRRPGLEDPHELLRAREEKHALLQRMLRLEELVAELQRTVAELQANTDR